MSVSLGGSSGQAATGMQPTKPGTVVENPVDAFDKDDFDPLRYINDMFPSGRHAVTSKVRPSRQQCRGPQAGLSTSSD